MFKRRNASLKNFSGTRINYAVKASTVKNAPSSELNVICDNWNGMSNDDILGSWRGRTNASINRTPFRSKEGNQIRHENVVGDLWQIERESEQHDTLEMTDWTWIIDDFRYQNDWFACFFLPRNFGINFKHFMWTSKQLKRLPLKPYELRKKLRICIKKRSERRRKC